jgi:aromatic-L-amino-acid/L-tryptophan decarboxylase
MPGVTHWRSPGFFAYFPANASLASVLGDLVSAGLGVQGMLWSTSPACTEIETRVMDWLAEALGLPEEFTSRNGLGGGVIQGTASEAQLVTLLAARDRAMRAGHKIDSLRVYSTDQAHSLVIKNARIAGFAPDAVRQVGTDMTLAMDTEALRGAIERDVAAGRVPCFINATVGTTSSTAIDPLDGIGPIAQEHGAWLHVDAAYAGAACVCPEHRWMIEGVAHADSFNMNPHKWLLTAFDCSALWVRDREAVLDALSILPEYLRNKETDEGGVIDYRDWQVPLGRRFRALKLWFAFRHFGIEGMRHHIRRSIELAQWFERQVVDDARFELAAPRTLGLVCFRLRDDDSARQDARNEKLLESLNDSGTVFLTHTKIPGLDAEGGCVGEPRYTIRFAVGSVMTRREHVERAWALIDSLVK